MQSWNAQASLADAGEVPDRRPDADIEAVELRAVVESTDMQDIQRQVLTLHGIVGMSQCDVAQTLGLTPSQVSKRWLKGLRKMRAALSPPKTEQKKAKRTRR
jgi:DNA-directed RNA polymerase specialized sigma24 family protein